MAALNPPIHSGFIANTDFGWFSHFLHRDEPPDEVDLWQPSPHGFKAIPPGAPFFFRLGAPQLVQPRLGQGAFRLAVTGAYGACAVSGEHSLPALEAAHVRPYAEGGAHVLPRRAAAARRHPPTLRRRLRHRHTRPPLPRQPRPLRRLPQRPRVRALCRPHHHESEYVAEVDVELIYTDEGWSPCLSLQDASKLDDVREALRRGDIAAAAKLARVYTLTGLWPEPANGPHWRERPERLGQVLPDGACYGPLGRGPQVM